MRIWFPKEATVTFTDPFTGEKTTMPLTCPMVAVAGTKREVDHAAGRVADIMADALPGKPKPDTGGEDGGLH